MARVTVFGAGAAGTALAMHLAREGEDVVVWGTEFDERALALLRAERRHPSLPEHLPAEARILGPEDLPEAAANAEIAVLAANSAGARNLARMIGSSLGGTRIAVSIAKGLEPETLKRMSEVYAEELMSIPIVALSGPSLAAEVAEGLHTAVAMASEDAAACQEAADVFRSKRFLVDQTDDVAGIEICGFAKNVAAIGAGIMEGLSEHLQRESKNPRAALFTRALHEMAELCETMGGRRETAFGLAGVGDLLVTSLGGRNRMYGAAIGMGAEPDHTLHEMQQRGLTVEGSESARDVHLLTERMELDLPVHEAVYRILHEGDAPESVLEALR